MDPNTGFRSTHMLEIEQYLQRFSWCSWTMCGTDRVLQSISACEKCTATSEARICRRYWDTNDTSDPWASQVARWWWSRQAGIHCAGSCDESRLTKVKKWINNGSFVQNCVFIVPYPVFSSPNSVPVTFIATIISLTVELDHSYADWMESYTVYAAHCSRRTASKQGLWFYSPLTLITFLTLEHSPSVDRMKVPSTGSYYWTKRSSRFEFMSNSQQLFVAFQSMKLLFHWDGKVYVWQRAVISYLSSLSSNSYYALKQAWNGGTS